MPIAIGVGLEEDGARGILGGISGDGEGLGEVGEMEDGAREKEFLKFIEGLLTSGSPIPVIVFLGEVEEGAGDCGVVGDEPMIEVSKAEE